MTAASSGVVNRKPIKSLFSRIFGIDISVVPPQSSQNFYVKAAVISLSSITAESESPDMSATAYID